MAKEQAPAQPHFEEVLVRLAKAETVNDRRVSTFEKLKVMRPKVKIQKHEADTINFGICGDERNILFNMYLLPGEEPMKFVHGNGKEAGHFIDEKGTKYFSTGKHF